MGLLRLLRNLKSLIETAKPAHSLLPSFPRTRESSAFRARTFEVAGFPLSRNDEQKKPQARARARARAKARSNA
ncbi:hypothetical protein [Lysobacter gummosus]|uniref:hypothetical protein n=1 Tax=Lysobacter gummosus TaxID=262324 RepID=UPI0036289D2C